MIIPDASSLRRTEIVKKESNNKIYEVVLERCVDQIVHTSETTDKTYTLFSVPLFLIGVPLYNKTSCVMFLMSELSKKNYIAKFIEPMYLHIDWGKRVFFDNNSKYIKKILEKHPDAKIEFVYQ